MNESPNSTTQHKCYLSFYYRRTGFKAISDTILIDINGNILPSRLMTSHSGRHGERQYSITPGKYIAYDTQRSNLGNTYIILRVIDIDNECNVQIVQEWTLHAGKIIATPLEKLPDNIQRILLRHKDELPLFDYIYW